MTHLFTIILVQPILNLLVVLYNYIHDVGLVIIVVTLIIRLLLIPSFHKSLKSQKEMAELQPKMNAVREKFKNDREGQARAMMELYKEHKVNPFSSCLPLLIQLPILIALYQVFRLGLGGHDLSLQLYKFVHNPGGLNPYFIHLVNLAKPNWLFGVLAGILQYFQSKMILPKEKSTDATQAAMAMQTLYVLPALTVVISLKLPAGLPLYWMVNTIFAIVQQYYIMRANKQEIKQELANK